MLALGGRQSKSRWNLRGSGGMLPLGVNILNFVKFYDDVTKYRLFDYATLTFPISQDFS